MTRIVAQFDPSATPGGSFFATMISTQPFGLYVTNDSPYGLNLDFGNALTRIAPPYTGKPFKVCVHCERVDWTFAYTVPIPGGIVTSTIVVEMYQQSELGDLPKESVALGRLTGVNNNVPLSASISASQVTAGLFVVGCNLTVINSDGGNIISSGDGELTLQRVAVNLNPRDLLVLTRIDPGGLGAGSHVLTIGSDGGLYIYDLVNAAFIMNGAIGNLANIATMRSLGPQAVGFSVWTGTNNPVAKMADGDLYWPI